MHEIIAVCRTLESNDYIEGWQRGGSKCYWIE